MGSDSERMAITCAICASVSTVNTMVCQCAWPVCRAQACTARHSPPMSRPTPNMCCHMPCANRLSRGARGGRCMMPALGWLGRQCQAGQAVGHQVDPQDVDGQQRNGQQQQRREEDGPDLARVARHRVAHKLADVVVDAAAFAHRRDDGGEVVVQQHQARCLARHVGTALAHRNADIGAFEGRGVVHAVACHSHEVALGLQAPRRCGSSAPGPRGRRPAPVPRGRAVRHRPVWPGRRR